MNAELDKWWARERLLDIEDIAPVVIIDVNGDDIYSLDLNDPNLSSLLLGKLVAFKRLASRQLPRDNP